MTGGLIKLKWDNDLKWGNGTSIKLNAFKGKKNVGYCTALVQTDCDEMCIEAIHVKKDYRRCGIGRALIQEMIDSDTYSVIYIVACPYGSSPRIPLCHLKTFYCTFGFKVISERADSVSMRLVNKENSL